MDINNSVLRPYTSINRINSLLAGRWSSRAIDSTRNVEASIVEGILEAARWAPSAANNQPWRIMAFGPSDPETREKARSTLATGNAWALKAPWLLFILSRTDRPGSGSENTRADYETGMAAVSMALQAADEGLVFHQMAGFNAKEVQQLFSVPDNFRIIVAAVLGYPGGLDEVPEAKREAETAERIRKGLDEIVYMDGKAPSE